MSVLANIFYIYNGSKILSFSLHYVVPDASKNGVAQETIQNTIRRAGKVMTEQEARQILGVTEETPWQDILKVS